MIYKENLFKFKKINSYFYETYKQVIGYVKRLLSMTENNNLKD